MNLDSRQPTPVFRKLLLENKILLFMGCLLLLLGGVMLLAQYWATGRVIERATIERLRADLLPAFESSDLPRARTLLEAGVHADPRIAYLAVLDLDDQPLAVAARDDSSLAQIAAALGELPSSPAVLARAIPLVTEGDWHGTLHVGFDRRRLHGFSLRIVGMVAGLMVIPVCLVLLIARFAVRRSVQPLKRLTQIADEISTGSAVPWFDFGERVNCWEIKNCGRTDCRAYANLDQQCWFIDGTPCEGHESRFPEKLEECRSCEVYQLHRGDEIVQLADSFKHMTSVLEESREELVQSSDFQRRVIRNSFNGVVATDADGTITIYNRVAEELIGVAREEVIGKQTWQTYFKNELKRTIDQPLSYGRVRRVRGFRSQESAIRRGDGKLVDVLLSGISLYERGIHIGKVFFFQDLSEIKQLREDLIRSERLAATGQAAAGISHSIKNILDGFLGGAYVFKAGKRRGDEEKMERGWEMVERNTEIISNLVRDLLNFSKERVPEYEEIDPAALIADAVASTGTFGNGRIEVSTEIETPGARVSLDSHAFHQCLVNLIRNAAEAVPEDVPGHVTIRFLSDGETAVFAVSDDGIGMSPEIVEKIKGGMVSTKGSKGTGLGLLVIQKIVGEHGGTLTIESAEGEGSTFRIEIPAAAAPSAGHPLRS